MSSSIAVNTSRSLCNNHAFHSPSKTLSKSKPSKLLITALYKLPDLYSPSPKRSPKRSPNHTIITSINKSTTLNQDTTTINNSKPHHIPLNTSPNVNANTSEISLTNFDNHFKDKFYEDTKTYLTTRQSYKLMFEDYLLKNRVIHMKQVMAFWKSLCEYSNPLFSMQKFNQLKRKDRNEKKLDCYFYSIGSNSTKTQTVKLPKLYTNTLTQKMNHKRRKDNEKEFYTKNILHK